ncbi:unnamed protein product [Adineta ricciae]|uniref:Uncharacterized protein n=1 Tax=Adineta ricciae TaxID=249248 RepID=A0A813RSU3_ADIRI|nr:unnamed protein product [Adineta ricciae]
MQNKTQKYRRKFKNPIDIQNVTRRFSICSKRSSGKCRQNVTESILILNLWLPYIQLFDLFDLLLKSATMNKCIALLVKFITLVLYTFDTQTAMISMAITRSTKSELEFQWTAEK